ncbi:arylsulfatase regulator (Fe-S oxidoreductase) [Shewanella sediminis HAW-EB3]|uniref:Arylsulfatase regulator (Fe-S oxidoreductase) n=1 Tax=Shewanella sediminis (strain HAW-EB3) TaxID=425104 RepID=A8G0G8_SHESH|nr:anaerobic sulfatase maturase [Shewanella sediminis]ABV38591.1 arylsulfatase regulator (Fe-S oxidoreductase) [Shewanella sediminis HAW-EB3]
MNHLNLPFSLFIKSEGAKCNLDCSYCYYLNHLDEADKNCSMSEELMGQLIKEHIKSQPNKAEKVDFIWHGGEPMLRGLEFYQSAVKKQHESTTRKVVMNTMQTNGTLINERWAQFFSDHNFMLGVSIDGPNLLNDIARVDKKGHSSFERTMRGIKHLKNFNVEFNTLTVVNNKTYRHAKHIYPFLKEAGSGYMQFQPCVDHELDSRSEYNWSLTGKQWGLFLCELFDLWSEKDVGKVYIQFFENCLMILMGYQSQMCHHSRTCGQQLMVETDGSVYSCDHYGYDEFKLSNSESSLKAMANSERQVTFGAAKYEALSNKCRDCDFLDICNGGCPKNRTLKTVQGENHNVLCEGYEIFFKHALPKMLSMVDAMKQGYSPAFFPIF